MSGKYPRLDRTQFRHQTLNQADHQLRFWLKKSPAERLEAAYYLISSAYGFDPDAPPRLDRKAFSARKHSA